ncbi:phage/plasmid primase, P4 family [Mycobacterium kansasii]
MIASGADNTADERSWGLEFDRLPGRTRSGYRLRLVPPLAHPDAVDAQTYAADDDSGPYQRAWSRYFEAGYAPFPLKRDSKSPPPSDYTGTRGKRADTAQLIEWATCPHYAGGNIACWLGVTITIAGVEYQLVGIDVDQYADKQGGDQLKALERELGVKLPDTWISGARTDGHSGIRWFLVPLYDEHGKRIDFRAKADSAIDVIQRKHRYAVVWPSRHPDGGVYWWFPPGVKPDDDGRSAWTDTDALPVLAELPVLPDAWVTYLREHRSHSGEIDLDISVTDLFDWTDDAFNDGSAAEICWNMACAAETFKTKITDDESSHDKITDAHWLLFSLAAEGHTGWRAAVEAVEKHWLRTVLKSGKRNLEEARSEVFRSRTGALRKIKVRVDRETVPAQCDCAAAGANLGGGKGANVWHSAEVPRGVARQFALLNEREDAPIRRWRGDWYQHDGTCWKQLDDETFFSMLYERLETATCLKAATANGVTTFKAVPWNPNNQKLFRVQHALASLRPNVLVGSEIDAPCWLDGREDRVIAFTNTLLRLEDRKQIDHTPAYFNTFALPFAYEPLAPTPQRWLDFLEEIWPDDSESIALLQEWFGYVLSGRMDLHKLLAIFGLRRTGKGTIMHVLKALIGEWNAVNVSADSIAERFGLEPLINKPLAVIDEMVITGSGKNFVAHIKNITGEGYPGVPRKNRQNWDGKLRTRFVFLANEAAHLPDASGTIIDRMLVLETTHNFDHKLDTSLREKLEVELPGIFNWALDGLDRLNRQGRFTEPQSTREFVGQMYRTSSPITQFIEDHCELVPDGYVPRKTAFELWQHWCRQNGFESGNINTFLSKLRAAFGDRINADNNAKRGPRDKQERAILGIRWKSGRIRLINQVETGVIPMHLDGT